MADFLSDEWFAGVVDAAQDLPEIEDLSFAFDVEIAESAAGKVRAHGQVAGGRLTAFEAGKFVSDPPGGSPDVSFVAKAKRALPIVHGEVPPLVAYMLGELKIDGRYELVVDDLANAADRQAFESFRQKVSSLTE